MCCPYIRWVHKCGDKRRVFNDRRERCYNCGLTCVELIATHKVLVLRARSAGSGGVTGQRGGRELPDASDASPEGA